MAGTVYIRIQTNGDTTWWMPDCDSAVDENSLEEAARFCEGNHVIVFIPGREVLLNQVSIPIKGRQRLIKAIPYALEDQFIDDIEELHFAIPDKLPEGATPVCSIKRSVLDEYLERLLQFNITPNTVVPDLLALPWQENHWSILVEKDDTLIRTGPFEAYSIDTENWIPYLQIAYESQEQVPETFDIWQHGQSTTEVPQAPEGLENTAWNVLSVQGNLTPFLVEYYQSELAINFLQGSYQPKRSRLRVNRNILSLASLVLIFLFLQAVYALTNYISMSRQSAQIQAQIESIFHQAMPETRRMVDPRAQMSQRLSELKGGAASNKIGFLELLAMSAPKFQGINGLTINGINYRDGNLDVDMNLRDVQMLEKLKQEIISTGLAAEIRSATAQGEIVTGHLRISGVRG